METIIAVCLVVLVLEVGILITFLAFTLLQIKRAAQAAEVLTYRVDGQVAAFGEAVNSGWLNLLGSICNLFGRFSRKS